VARRSAAVLGLLLEVLVEMEVGASSTPSCLETSEGLLPALDSAIWQGTKITRLKAQSGRSILVPASLSRITLDQTAVSFGLRLSRDDRSLIAETVPTYFVTGGACQHLICLTADVDAFRNSYGDDAAEIVSTSPLLVACCPWLTPARPRHCPLGVKTYGSTLSIPSYPNLDLDLSTLISLPL